MEDKKTYSLSHQKYYTEHKTEINERRKEYARAYGKTYYEEHKQEINARRKRPNKVGRPPKPREDLREPSGKQV